MKLISLDNLLATALVFSIMLFFPAYFNLDFLDPVSQTLQDFYITDVVFSKIRDNSAVEKDTDIVLVNYGYLDRRGIAAQLEIINRYEPKVIAFDTFFRQPKGIEQDKPLEAAMSRVKNLVLVSQLTAYNPGNGQFDSLLTSYYIFNHHAKTGFANIVINQDYFRTVRTFSKLEFFTPQSDRFPSLNQPVKNNPGIVNKKYAPKAEQNFSVRIAGLYRPESIKKLMNRGIDNEIINFRRNLDKYSVLDVNEVFSRRDSLGFVRGKIVIFGFLGPDTKTLVTEDNFFTPMNQDYVGKTYPDMYGPVIHANIISMILSGDYLGSTPDWLAIVLVILITYGNMSLFSFIRSRLEHWYEPLSIMTTLSEVFILLMLIIFTFHLAGFEINIRGAFIAIMLSVPAYETYFDSLKPIAADAYKKLKKRISK